jgi:valyl-tRNA synthetase
MNKENKQLLKALEINYLTLKHPTMPYITASDWNDNSANALTKCIIHFLTYSGFQAERINTMGVYREGKKIQVGENTRQLKGTYTPSTGTKGSADISATIRGRSVKIEVKQKDKQSEVQKQYQQSIEKAGGVYMIFRNFDDFIIWYNDFISKI